jgi:hypothetical protein
VQAVLELEIKHISQLSSPTERVCHFLAVLHLFGDEPCWIRQTQDSAAHFRQLLAPLVKLAQAIMKTSNTALGIDEEGKRFIQLSILDFDHAIAKEASPSPLFEDAVKLSWPSR